MNSPQLHNGKISIHEPLTVVDPKKPEEIFKRDILNRQRLAERILNRLQEDDCPSALGVYGGWGTGKTSLLNLLKQLNERSGGASSKLHILSVDAWEHESSEGLLIPVVVELNEIKGIDVPAKQLAVVVKRALFASGMIFAGAMLKKYTDLELQQIQEGISDAASHDGVAHESILRKWTNEAKEISQTKDAFASLIDSARRHTGRDNIVICIDNLDRCSPDNVVRLLESVKVFFNVPSCTWVFAVDSEVIANYINHKYAGARMDGNSYLDKIIPEQYHLSLSPSIDGKNIADLLQYAAGGNVLKFDERSVPQLPRVLVPRRLIKSAAKFAEFKRLYAQGESRTPDTLVFNLALLYHVWPDFYQRFSSASEAHIRSILDNFFPVETPVQAKPESVGKVNANLLPLLKDYAEDQDLFYFLKTVFSEYQRSKNAFVYEVINGISGLRKVGLP